MASVLLRADFCGFYDIKVSKIRAKFSTKLSKSWILFALSLAASTFLVLVFHIHDVIEPWAGAIRFKANLVL